MAETTGVTTMGVPDCQTTALHLYSRTGNGGSNLSAGMTMKGGENGP